MAEQSEFIDIKVDIDDINTGALELLKHLRPDWNKDDIKIKVGLDRTRI